MTSHVAAYADLLTLEWWLTNMLLPMIVLPAIWWMAKRWLGPSLAKIIPGYKALRVRREARLDTTARHIAQSGVLLVIEHVRICTMMVGLAILSGLAVFSSYAFSDSMARWIITFGCLICLLLIEWYVLTRLTIAHRAMRYFLIAPQQAEGDQDPQLPPQNAPQQH